MVCVVGGIKRRVGFIDCVNEMQIGHCKEFLKLKLLSVCLLKAKDERVTLETSAIELGYGGQFTLSTR